MLAKYNLYAGGVYESGTWKEYKEEATGIQDPTMIAYDENVGTEYSPGAAMYSTDNVKGENYSSYEGSLVQRYVNNYKMYLETTLASGITEARLLTLDEVRNLGCGDTSCTTTSAWIYATSYWLETPYNNDNNYCIHSNGDLNEDPYNLDSSPCGVRPVITISKSVF